MSFKSNGNSPGVTEFVDGQDDQGSDIDTQSVDQKAIDRGDIVEGDEPELSISSDNTGHDEGEAGQDDTGDQFTEEELKNLLDEEEGKVRIPKARFDEVNERMKAAEAELSKLKSTEGKPDQTHGQQQEQTPFDFKAKRKERAEAMMDGDTELVAQIDQEIDEALLVEAERRAEARLAAKEAEKEAKVLADVALEAANKALDDFPFLKDNDEAMSEVIALRDVYQNAGVPRPEAIAKAASRIATLYGHKPALKATEEENAESRKQTSMARNADAANRQPPPTARMGSGNRATVDTVMNPLQMTAEEIAALPIAERKRLRGDVI
ncbi:MAG: hypothetical protein KKD63_11105 [Proteobacteria bacterium]|nr:hypothetical protein [Desulfobulbaceae bacterium]MBU4153419.1 hypothetical protein [Pseudomonadota bacterium]